MKINRSNKTPTKITATIIAIVVLASIATYAAFSYLHQKDSPTNTAQQKKSPEGIDYNQPTKEQQAAGTVQKNQAQTQAQSDKASTTNSNGKVTVTIPSIMSSDGQVRISTLIEAVTNDGTCTLSLSKDGTVVTKQSGIQAGPSSSTCKGFTIPTSELSSGQWQATIQVQTGNEMGSATKVFQVD